MNSGDVSFSIRIVAKTPGNPDRIAFLRFPKIQMENGFYEKVLTQAAKEEIEKLGELALFLPETYKKENGAIYLHRFAS